MVKKLNKQMSKLKLLFKFHVALDLIILWSIWFLSATVHILVYIPSWLRWFDGKKTLKKKNDNLSKF